MPSNAMGIFSDTTLQDLYNTLAQQGLVSVGDALKVGAIIEEVDILDLEERIAATDKADIIQVYDSLLRGSRNHLRSFVQTLKTQTGETYTPQYLKTADYENIINSTKLNQQNVLIDLVKYDENQSVRGRAINKIKDQSILIKVAKTDKYWRIRSAATANISDKKILEDLSRPSPLRFQSTTW